MNTSRAHREARRAVRLARLGVHLLAGTVVTHGLYALLERLPRRYAERGKQTLVRWWARKLCRIMNVDLQIEGRASVRPTLFVANHVSWLDIPCMLATVNAFFVAKREVLDWPVVGAMAARSQTIFLERGGRDAAADTAEQMTWRLASRRSVIVFPEGTTTDGTQVRTFHARLYQAAIRTHSPIQAIAIRYGTASKPCDLAPFINNDTLLPHLWRLLGEERIVVRISLCDPVMPNRDRRTLADTTRTQISTVLGLESSAPVRAYRRR